MPVIDHLATSLGRRDEAPNQELARQIAARHDREAIAELVGLLTHPKKDIQSDSIKVLYEIGATQPALIAPHAAAFLALLDSKNNRLQWGAMTALDSIAALSPEQVFGALNKILSVAEKGSVITTDHAVGILIQLCGLPEYAETAFPLLNEQLLRSPENQLPMYAERAEPHIPTAFRGVFLTTLRERLGGIEKESKQKRVEKVIRKLSK